MGYRSSLSITFDLPRLRKSPTFSAPTPGGGGGGGKDILRVGSDGGVPLKPPKPIPIFKGHFGGKGYLLLRVFKD